jgi:hypothetical protein
MNVNFLQLHMTPFEKRQRGREKAVVGGGGVRPCMNFCSIAHTVGYILEYIF